MEQHAKDVDLAAIYNIAGCTLLLSCLCESLPPTLTLIAQVSLLPRASAASDQKVEATSDDSE